LENGAKQIIVLHQTNRNGTVEKVVSAPGKQLLPKGVRQVSIRRGGLPVLHSLLRLLPLGSK
jgi:hypothetical protein